MGSFWKEALISAIEEKSLHVSPNYKELRYRFPSCYYDLDTLQDLATRKEASFQLNQIGENISELTLQCCEKNVLDICRSIFSELNNLPIFSISSEGKPFRNSNKPLVSCIILLTANDFFVRTLAIPSLIINSRNYEIEIIIAYNGTKSSLEELSEFPVVFSEFGWVAKGYNAGARMAKGDYIAIFHDDCLINDPNWIQKCIDALDHETWAVSPEIRHSSSSFPLTVAKNIPLFMRKDVFDSLDGYDENYYFGCEDVDFTYSIMSKAKKIEQVDLNIFHGSGMSTIIFISNRAKMYRLLFGLNAFSPSLLEMLQNFYRCMFSAAHEEFQVVMAKQRLYFLEKHRSFLIKNVDQTLLDNDYQEVKRFLDTNAHFAFIHDPTQLMKIWQSWTKEMTL